MNWTIIIIAKEGFALKCKDHTWEPTSDTLQNMLHDLFGDWNSAGCLDMGTSWYFSLKLNYFGVLEWKEGPNNYILSCPDCGMLKRPNFHFRIPK